MTTPLEKAAKAAHDDFRRRAEAANPRCAPRKTWEKLKPEAQAEIIADTKAAVLSYLRALHEQGPSEKVLDAVFVHIRSLTYHEPRDYCAAVVGALIKELEGGK